MQPSKVGDKLVEATTLKLIFIVIIIVFVGIVVEIVAEDKLLPSQIGGGLTILSSIGASYGTNSEFFATSTSLYISNYKEVVYLKAYGQELLVNQERMDEIPKVDIVKFKSEDKNVEAKFDNTETAKLVAGMNILFLGTIICTNLFKESGSNMEQVCLLLEMSSWFEMQTR